MNERLEKVERLKNLGIEAYFKGRFPRTHLSEDAQKEAEEMGVRNIAEIQGGGVSRHDPILVCGRMVLFRSMGKLAFAHLQDEKGRIQVCFQRDMFTIYGPPYKGGKEGEEEMSPMKIVEKLFDLGDFLGVRGEIFRTNHGELTLFVQEVTLLSKALLPMPEKFHGLSDRETCYRERNLDLLTNPDTFARFHLRSHIIREIRDFFHKKSFLEIETPILQAQAGGAMAQTFSTHHNALDHDFVLRIALELNLKIAMGGGFERVFEIGKNFRNEGTDPSHLQEFTMCEWYCAYEDLAKNKEWTEELFHRITEKCLKTKTVTILSTTGEEVVLDFSKKFTEARFPDLLKTHADLDMFTATDDEVRAKAKAVGVDKITGVGRANLLDDIYKKTARAKLIEPTFVFDYPEELKPLARPNGDGTAECFQLVINGWEVVNSYGELVNPIVQRKLLEDQAAAKAGGDTEAMEVDEVFLTAMEHGFPPMTGSGFGIDRLVALLTAQPNLRDTVLFPTMKPEKKVLSVKEAEERYKSKKVVVIADESFNAGITANAIGQLGIEIGLFSEEQLFDAEILHDADNRIHYVDCLYPMANLRGTREQMAEFAQKCYNAGIQFFDFSDIMRKAHTDKQMQEGYLAKHTADIGYIAVGAVIPVDFEKEFLGTLALFGGE
ncbi:MAG: lysine--tRNA ligase [Candidatus Peregrinibacteria bacterium]